MNKKFIIITIVMFTMMIVGFVIFVGLQPAKSDEPQIPKSLEIDKKSIEKYGEAFKRTERDNGHEHWNLFVKDDPKKDVYEFKYNFQVEKIVNPKVTAEFDEKYGEYFDIKIDEKKRTIVFKLKKKLPRKGAHDIFFRSERETLVYIKIIINNLN